MPRAPCWPWTWVICSTHLKVTGEKSCRPFPGWGGGRQDQGSGFSWQGPLDPHKEGPGVTATDLCFLTLMRCEAVPSFLSQRRPRL